MAVVLLNEALCQQLGRLQDEAPALRGENSHE
jgi:hypothetical protein